jgi:hypothetical protein
VFENRALRRKLGPRRDKVSGSLRELHNEELHNLHSSLNLVKMIKSRMMRWTGHVAQLNEKKNAYRLLVGKPERKTPLRRPRRRWVDNIKMDLGEIKWVGME